MSNFPEIYNEKAFQTLDRAKQFKALLEKFCLELNLLGYNVLPYQNADLEQYTSLPSESQEKILDDFLIYYRCFVAASKDKIQPANSRSILWYFLKERGWIPNSDLFSFIGEDDLIEVYGTDFIQIFRNLKFFELCSYTLLDLFTVDWPSLFKRDMTHTTELVQTASKLISGSVRNTIIPNVQEHTIEELFSTNRNIFTALHKALAPVYDKNKNPVGFIGITEAKIVGSTQITQRARLSLV